MCREITVLYALLLRAAVHTVPPAISMKAAREEAEMVLYECVKEALAKSRIKPRQVGICLSHCNVMLRPPASASDCPCLALQAPPNPGCVLRVLAGLSKVAAL